MSARWFWSAFLVLYVLTALPILRAELPPLVDYPNHLARMHVLIDLPRSEALQQYYEIHWDPLPNLAMDLTVPALARIMSLELAGKLFVLVSLFLLPAGAALLHRVATGQWSIWPLFAFVFLYSHVLVWGFLNYLFGLGLTLMAFALWLSLAGHPAARIGAASISAFILYFAHLMACVVFGVLIAAHEVGEIWRKREFSPGRILARAVAGGLPFVLPLAILLGSDVDSGLGDFAYGGVLPKFGLAMFEGHIVLDVAATLIVCALAAIGYSRRVMTVVPALRVPLLVLALAYVLSPAKLMTAHGIEERVPLAFALVLAAGTISVAATRRTIRIAVLTGLSVFLVRTAAFELDSERANQVYPRLIAMLDHVPRGGRLAVAFDSNRIGPSGLPANHLPTIAVLRRDAFVPSFFAYETQQPVLLTPAARALRDAAEPRALWAAVMEGEAGEARARQALAGYDALAVLDPWPFTVPATRLLQPIGVEPTFAVYRVVH